MKKNLIFAIAVITLTLIVGVLPTLAGGADCTATGDGGIPVLSSLAIDFECAEDSVVYFGACDSGGVPNDDLFNITYMGSVVSNNIFVSGSEYVNIGQAQAAAGSHQAVLNSLNASPATPATYSFALSTDRGFVANYLANFCGADFAGTAAPSCLKTVPVFTEDTAPTDGTIRVDVQYGEMNREEGWTVGTFELSAGQRLNNATVSVPAPKYVRVWWQAEGSDTWDLLPSQYWTGSGTLASEYGVSCDEKAVPSYHTSFGSAVPDTLVPSVPALN